MGVPLPVAPARLELTSLSAPPGCPGHGPSGQGIGVSPHYPVDELPQPRQPDFVGSHADRTSREGIRAETLLML